MWVLDEASYRIDKTNFPTREEAEQKAAEAARILGRAINVYQLTNGELILDFQVNPDGTTPKESATQDPKRHETINPPTDAPVLGSAELMDAVAEVLEKAGRTDLATIVDEEVNHVSAKIPMPKVTVYDNGGETLDRYTIVLHGKEWDESANPGMKMMLGLSSDPATGFSQWTEGHDGNHLGKKIPFNKLPPNVQKHAIYRITEEGESGAAVEPEIPVGGAAAVAAQLKKSTAALDKNIQAVVNVLEANPNLTMMSLRSPLEKVFRKNDISFTFEPMPMFLIKVGGKKLIITNKENADEPEAVVGPLAVGYL